MAVTKEGEAADVKHCLDENKISEEVQYDRLYAVCTDLLDDEVGNILKVSESRWQIEECFRIMKTDFLQVLFIYRMKPDQRTFLDLFPCIDDLPFS